MTPATVARLPIVKRVSVVSVPLTPTQVMVAMEALRMARVEVLKAAEQLRHIYPESITHAEKLDSYAELMADTLGYFAKVQL